MAKTEKAIRLSKLAREFNVGITTLVDFLHKKGFDTPSNPNTKVDSEVYNVLVKEFGADINLKKESQKVSLQNFRERKESVSIEDVDGEVIEDSDTETTDQDEVFVKSTSTRKDNPKPDTVDDSEDSKIKLTFTGEKIDLDNLAGKKKEKPKEEKKEERKEEDVEAKAEKEEKKTTKKPEVKEPAAKKAKDKEPKAEATEKPKPTDKETKQPEEKKPKVTEKPESKSKDKTEEPKAKAVKPKKQEPDAKAEPKEEQPTQKKEIRKKGDKPKSEQAQPADDTKKPEGEGKLYRSEVEKLSGITVVGKIDLNTIDQKKKTENDKAKKRRRKRIRKDNQKVTVNPQGGGTQSPSQGGKGKPQIQTQANQPIRKKKKRLVRQEVNEEDVQKQIKETLARLTSKGGKSKGSKYRKDKRELVTARQQEEMDRQQAEKNILQVTEFVSVSELASMMDESPMSVIEVCMNLGLMVSINQRLDAETMAMVADEFGFKVEFVSVDLQESIAEEEDDPKDLEPRPPIVTVMGHVDHGKTSLLDFIRSANVIAGEAGGITQHIGAYSVKVEGDKRITFLDTPGHEAFTAMRARGAKITDVAIIVVSADDDVMPQTVEAINHASAAGVPIVFAINKIDKPNANPEKIKEALANMNYLVEEWGGKYQSQDISALKGENVDKLLEKVLLEAEILELKANPNKRASGTVIESSLDKGRGYTATILVEAGTLRQGEIMLAGTFSGHVKAMFNERGRKIKVAGPATPVQIIGLNGAPLSGDYFNVMESDKDARDIANKREQLQRMQGLRAQKHITLDEIGRRIAIGNFQELNVVLKGDVDGSIEALSDSLIKLSTEQIQVNVIHKAVGQISESDILLAAASNAIVIGFQVRPSASARKLAEKEQIDIRLYSIIYDAINEVKSAMEGMLAPEVKEEVLGTAEVLETFKITKVGMVAGCIVREGKILRNAKCRLIRDGIVVYTGDLGSLKRFKEDAREVANGFECGLNINNFNDIKVGDLIESFKEVEVKRTL